MLGGTYAAQPWQRTNCFFSDGFYNILTLLTKITAAQKEVALSYHRVRGLYFLVVIVAATIVIPGISCCTVVFQDFSYLFSVDS